jgi:hydrogenase maturation protease
MNALVAGVGNVFLRDDGFGVEVVQRLAARPLPPGTKVVDFGIRGLHLAFELLDGYETVVLVDALPRGGPPGTLYVLEPDTAPDAGAQTPPVDGHDLNPEAVLALARGLGGPTGRVLIVGCEPADVSEGMGLTAPVAAAVDAAVATVWELLGGDS